MMSSDAFHDFEQGRRIGEIAMRLQDHGHVAPLRILPKFPQAGDDAADRRLLGLLRNDLVAKDPDVGRQQTVGKIDKALALLQLKRAL